MQRPYPTTQDGALTRFAEERLLVQGEGVWHITNLGALLFAKDLRQFGDLHRKPPRIIVYKGPNKLETVREQIGIKGYAVGFDGLIEYINSQLPANEVIGQAFRTETKMYPEIAIRELAALL
jgi:predicted HTH transcriptional regulator